MDVFKAFLHGEIEETVCIKLPQGYKGLESRVSAAEGENCLADINLACKLKKVLYELRHAPRKWFLKLSTSILQAIGFVQSEADYNFFTKTTVEEEAITLLLVYVDDFMICGSSMKKSTYSTRTYHLHFI